MGREPLLVVLPSVATVTFFPLDRFCQVVRKIRVKLGSSGQDGAGLRFWVRIRVLAFLLRVLFFINYYYY